MVSERALVGAGDIREHLVFTLRFMDGKFGFAFGAGEFLHCGGALVEQGDDAAIHVVDQQTVLFELCLGLLRGHAIAPKPLLSSRAKSSSLDSSAGFSAFCSIRRTNALPTTTAST